jgi:phosphoglycerate dehydrogenase-like enzyme
MKPSAFLISNSRGGIVDEEALYKVLKEKRIAGAALDVYRWEPVPSDSPLLTLDNVSGPLPTGRREETFYKKIDVLANISRVARGEKPEFMI